MREARAKIVATLGPASKSLGVLVAIARAGADVVRINGAHVTPEALAPLVATVRRASRRAGRPLAVLVDLPGDKQRIGVPSGGETTLVAGRRVALLAGTGSLQDPGAIPIPPAVLRTLVAGSEVLLGDGNLVLRVLSRAGGRAVAHVEAGGLLRARVGIHVRGAAHAGPVPTRRDLRLAVAAVAAGADAVALSFVRGPKDVSRLRRHLAARRLPMPLLVAKLERREALANLDAVLDASDGVMVARGDLGLEYGPEEVPGLQKRILEAAGRRGRFVITATQMLESMTKAPRPTRAEASDVANAVFDGTDAVMLSGETAVGDHPALVVETMNRILLAAEADPHCPFSGDPRRPAPVADPSRPDRLVVRAAVRLADDVGAAAVVVFTRGGQSARRLAKERPRAPIYAFAAEESVARGLLLSWGVRPRRMPAGRTTDARLRGVLARLRKAEHLRRGARVVLVMGGAGDPAGTTSLVKLLTV
jgi:pyruvate kinase